MRMQVGAKENTSSLTEFYRKEYSNLVRMLHEKSNIIRTLYDYYVDIHESEITLE